MGANQNVLRSSIADCRLQIADEAFYVLRSMFYGLDPRRKIERRTSPLPITHYPLGGTSNVGVRPRGYPGSQTSVESDRRDQAGVSLIETVLAILILAFALLSLAQTMALSIRVNANARQGVSTLSLAQMAIENFKNTAGVTRASYDTLANGSQNYLADGAVAEDSDTAAFTVEWTVTSGALTDFSGNPAYKTIKVRSRATKSQYGPAAEITLTTQIARPSS